MSAMEANLDKIIADEIFRLVEYRREFGITPTSRSVAAYETRRARSRQFCPQVELPVPQEVIL